MDILKSIYYNTGIAKSIPIIIKKGKYKEYINVKKNNIIIYDKKIKVIDELNLSNSISVIGNENLKSFDKYLSLIMKLSDKKIRFHGCRAVRHDDHIHIQLK